MAKEKDGQPQELSSNSVFEVAKIRELIELMREHELNEIDLKQSEQRIRLRRGAPAATVVQYAQPVPAAASPVLTANVAPVAVAAAADNSIFIVSPTIGTFYSRPKQDAANFVKIGDTVTPDTIVCLVEAMKMFNEIPAGVSGKIVEMLVKNEEAVDNNRPLFRVVPT